MSSARRSELQAIGERVVRCRRCPELRAYCREVARTKRRAFAGWDYWGRPVPGFGDPGARIWIIGLAPAAHGANRTGRMFTGDRSGDFLFAALHRAGLANSPRALDRDDGLVLRGAYISSACRCAPPANRPTASQLARCSSYLDGEAASLDQARVLLALGGVAWEATLKLMHRLGVSLPRPRPRFAHGAEVRLGPLWVLGSYHVSQQNTFTGRLTPAMLDRVLARARLLAALPGTLSPRPFDRQSGTDLRPRPRPRAAGDHSG